MNQIMFWSSPLKGESISEWREKELLLTSSHLLALESHKKVGQSVILYTYQHIINTNLPDNVQIKDAHEFYDVENAYSALLIGHHIAHISDLIRLRAASRDEGVVIDLDTLMIRAFPDKGFLCSMPAKLTGAFAPKWGEAHPPLTVNDKSWDGKALSNFPVSVDKQMGQLAYNLTKAIEERLANKPSKSSKGWNFIMWGLKEFPKVLKDHKVYPPIYTCPSPPWLGKGKCYTLEYPTKLDGKTRLFGYTMPSIKTIFKKSFCVQHFFESAYKGADMKDSSFWNTVHEESLLGQEVKYILGNNWRKVLLDQ